MTNADEIHNQRLTVGIMATCLALAAASFALRIYARATTAAKLWYDDYWMAVVMVVSVAMSTSTLLGLEYGSGTHQRYLAEETVQSFKKNLYIYMILWSFGVFAVKVGILLFYWRVFSTPRFRRAVLAVGGLSACILLVNFFTFTFQCWPIARFWDESIQEGACIAQTEFYLASAVINVVGDVVVLVLPLPVVWSLHTSQSKKWSLSFLFLLGALYVFFSFSTFPASEGTNTNPNSSRSVCVASIFRILAVEEIDPEDFTFSNVGGGLWSTVEVEVGFICANLPSIRPLVFRCLGYRVGVASGRDNDYYSTPDGERYYTKSGGESSAGLKTIGSKPFRVGGNSSKQRRDDGNSLSRFRDSDEEALTQSRAGSRAGSSRAGGEPGQAIGLSDIMVKTHIGISVEPQSMDPSPLNRSHTVQISSPKDTERP
ncbi:hypothetical protein PG996_015900 [Apiospora saccharicola]|uniref:Rhodopsin domain-containing protein n=1 Tax=Apiospora saccharicola TaxID=335842 RepID=A0ABR1TME6_9PEZI